MGHDAHSTGGDVGTGDALGLAAGDALVAPGAAASGRAEDDGWEAGVASA